LVLGAVKLADRADLRAALDRYKARADAL